MQKLKIYTTLDCVKLTPFEKIILATIKGLIYDYHHAIDGDPLYENETGTVQIEVVPLDVDKNLTCFRVIGNGMQGLGEDVKRMLEPFAFGLMFQLNRNEDKKKTSIIMQRFEVQRQMVPTYSTIKPTK